MPLTQGIGRLREIQREELLYRGGISRDLTPYKLGIELGACFIAVDSLGNIYGSPKVDPLTIVKSGDRGRTWKKVLTADVGAVAFWGVWVDTKDNLFAWTKWDGQLYKSTDYGKTWKRIPQALTSRYPLTEDPDGNLYLAQYGLDKKVYKSTDRGETWIELATAPPAVAYDHWHFIAADPYTGYLYAAYGDVNLGLRRSTDKGDTWTTLETGKSYTAIEFSREHIFLGSDLTINNHLTLLSKHDDTWDRVYLPRDVDSGIFLIRRGRHGTLYLGTTFVGGIGLLKYYLLASPDGVNFHPVAAALENLEFFSNPDPEGFIYSPPSIKFKDVPPLILPKDYERYWIIRDSEIRDTTTRSFTLNTRGYKKVTLLIDNNHNQELSYSLNWLSFKTLRRVALTSGAVPADSLAVVEVDTLTTPLDFLYSYAIAPTEGNLNVWIHRAK